MNKIERYIKKYKLITMSITVYNPTHLESAITSKFQKIFVLSMINRKDRQEMMKKQSSNLFKMDLFKYSKIDGEHLASWFYGTTFPHNDIIASAFNQSKRGRFTKPNEYDCSRNHYAMVKICYEMGCEHCLIIEDDLLFLKNADKIGDYIFNLPDDYDIAQFGGFTVDVKIQDYMKSEGDNAYWVKHKDVGVWTTSMYALSRRGMEYYLAFMDKLFWVADGPLYKAPINDKIVNSYIAREPIVIQADKDIMSSDIRDKSNDSIDYNNQNAYETNIDKSDYFEIR